MHNLGIYVQIHVFMNVTHDILVNDTLEAIISI